MKAVAILTGLLACTCGAASAQEYPTKPVRIITGGVGGGNDLAARTLAPQLSGSLGQQFVVDNRAAGIAPQMAVLQSAADGYTLLVAADSLWTVPLLQKTPYDPLKDFAAISLTTRAPFVLVVTPSLPVKSVSDLIALAKSKPGVLNHSTNTIGNSSYIAAEAFKLAAGIQMENINYKSRADEAADLLRGQVQLSFFDAGTAKGYMKAGTLRGLGIVSAQRSTLLPDLPPIGASLPGYEARPQITGVFAPAKTSDAILKKLNQEVVRGLKQQDVKDRLNNAGVEAVGSTPEEFTAEIKSATVYFAKVIKAINLKID